MRQESQGGALQLRADLEADLDAVRSPTPAVYVPRRFRIDGIDGILSGAAIVGTPQGDGMVAIDVESDPDIEPQGDVWNLWAETAARRHAADDEEIARLRRTRLVSEAALIQIGQFVGSQVLIDDAEKEAELSRWLQAGRADYVVERPFPHQP